MRFDVSAMRVSAADEGLYATDLAEALVRTACRSAMRTGGPERC